MKPITTEESKQIQLEILQSIHDFCEQNGLTYYLWFGTLLGAVRHKGFIPWDDDIDILMPRKDFEVFREKYSSEHTKLVDCKKCKEYYLHIAKVTDTRTVLKENVKTDFPIGVYVDVFVLDELSSNEKKNKRTIKRLQLLRDVIMLNVLPNSGKRKGIRKFVHSVLSVFTPLINMNKTARKMDQIAQDLTDHKGSRSGILMHVSQKGMEKRYDNALFKERILTKFEDDQFWIPREYDAILHKIYGDYMQLPPESQRVSRHEYEQYRID